MKNNVIVSKRLGAFGIASAVVLSAFVLVSPVYAETLTRELQFGMSGSNVSLLQEFLAKDSTIYPQGLVTGYFGPLTKSAVSNFQARNGIATVGRVGPATLSVINAQMKGGVFGSDANAAVFSMVNVGTGSNSVVVSWTTNEPVKGSVFYSTSPLSEYESPHSVSIGGTEVMSDGVFRNSQSVTLSNLQRDTVYYYDIYVTDASGNASMTMQNTFRTSN